MLANCIRRSVLCVPGVDDEEVRCFCQLDQAVGGDFVVEQLDLDAFESSFDQLGGALADSLGEGVDRNRFAY